MLTDKRKGFTIIEAVVAMALLSIIAAVMSGIVASPIQMLMYLPDKMDARAAAQDIVSTMIEGEAGSRGVRYSFGFNTLVMPPQDYVFIYDAGRLNMGAIPGLGDPWYMVTFYKYPSPPLMKRTVLSVTETIPYYRQGEISVAEVSPGASIFRYYKSDGTEYGAPGDTYQGIKRIDIDMIVNVAGGGSFRVTTGVEIKQYE